MPGARKGFSVQVEMRFYLPHDGIANAKETAKKWMDTAWEGGLKLVT
jgi:hypothetical protein